MDKVGAGGLHGAEKGERERVAGRQENPDSKSSGVGRSEGGFKAAGVAGNPGEVAKEREGESSFQGASTPPKWKSCPRGTKPPE